MDEQTTGDSKKKPKRKTALPGHVDEMVMPEFGKWFRCADRLPKPRTPFGSYIIYSPPEGKKYFKNGIITILRFDRDKQTWLTEENLLLSSFGPKPNITNWMIRPEKPKT